MRQRSNIRRKSPDKHTVDVWKLDWQACEKYRVVDIGKVSVADIFHQMRLAYEYCKEHGIDYKPIEEKKEGDSS